MGGSGRARDTRLGAVAVVLVLVLGPVLAAIGWSALGGSGAELPDGLNAAIRRSLRAPGVHVDGTTKQGPVTEDFAYPDRSRYTLPTTPDDLVPATTNVSVGGTMYETDWGDPSRYISCPLPPAPRGVHLAFTPTLENVAILTIWGTVVGSKAEAGGGRRYVVQLSRAPREYHASKVRVTVVVRSGRVVEVDNAIGSGRLRFHYRPVTIQAPPRTLVTARPDCSQSAGFGGFAHGGR